MSFANPNPIGAMNTADVNATASPPDIDINVSANFSRDFLDFPIDIATSSNGTASLHRALIACL